MYQKSQTNQSTLNYRPFYQTPVKFRDAKELNQFRCKKKNNRDQIKKSKRRKRQFASLAKVYLQNPQFLRSQQLKSLLNYHNNQNIFRKLGQKVKQKSENMLNRKIVNRYSYEQRISRELSRRKLQHTFRISPNCIEKVIRCNSPNSSYFIKRKLDKSTLEYQPNKTIKSTIMKNTINNAKEIKEQNLNSSIQNYEGKNNIFLTTYVKKKTNNKDAIQYKTIKNKNYNEPMDESSKIRFFILNSKDHYVRRLLEKYGWRQNKNHQSNLYDLKWSFKEEIEQYKTLQVSENKRQLKFYNHIKGNEMTSKYGLLKLTKQMSEAGMRVNSFIPRGFQISDYEQIKKNFELTSLLIILRKHVNYIKSKMFQEYHKILYLIQRKKKNHLEQELFQQFLIRKQYTRQLLDPNFVININIILQTLIFLEKQRKNRSLQQQIEEENATNNQQQAKILKTLIKFSKIEPPYQQYLHLRNSNMKQQYSNLKKSSKFSKKQSRQSWATPSIELVYKIIYYYQFFFETCPEFNRDGIQNIWIVKPSSSSRGVGIFLTDNLQVIHENRERNKIVQKYIEDIWIYNEEKYNSIADDFKDKIFYKYHYLMNKKFDIRQWVLISSINPFEVYIFSKFYLKVCSQDYYLKDIKNLSKHLSNYSINKCNFENQATSIVSENQFQKLLNILNIDIKPLKKKIREIISDVVRVGCEQLEHIQGTFEILGFDLMLDSNLNPWIIEINMSPACAQRTIELTKMVDQMALSTMNIIIPKQILDIDKQQLNKIEYKWEELIMQEKNEIKCTQKLQLICKKLNVVAERKMKKYFNIELQKKIIMVQRRIRSFLNKK